MSPNSPWMALKLLLTIPLNYELNCFNSSLGSIQMWAHKQYQAYMDMSNNNNAKYKERVERERFKRKYKDMFRGSSHCSSPLLHTEGFQLSTIRSSTKWPPLRNYNKLGVYNSTSLTPLHKRVGTEQREKIQLVDHLDHKQQLGDHLDHKRP